MENKKVSPLEVRSVNSFGLSGFRVCLCWGDLYYMTELGGS